MELRLNVLKKEDTEFYYVYMGSELHFRPSFRLWVNKKLVEHDENGYPIVKLGKGRRIIRTEKGNYVLKGAEDRYVFNIGWECGYRGSSSYEILNTEAVELELPYERWHSPRGSLGVSRYALISATSNRLLVRLKRNGRLYGKPSQMTVEYYIEGDEQREQEVPEAEDTELILEIND